METDRVSEVSSRAEVILDAASRLYLDPSSGQVSMDDLARELGMAKKTIYKYFADKQTLMIAVLDRQFDAIERNIVAATDRYRGNDFDERVRGFLLAAGKELQRIGAAQLASARGDAVLRQYVGRRVDAVVYQRLDDLFRAGHGQGLLSVPPELLGEIVRGAVERLLNSGLERDLNYTAAELLSATVDTVLYGAIGPHSESRTPHD